MTTDISSRQNSWFQRIRHAVDRHADEIAIEGPKMVGDAIAAGWKPIVIATRSGDDPSTWPPSLLHVRFTTRLFDSLSETNTPQGVLGLFERPQERDVFARRDSITVALDGVQDPGNVGTIIRLAAAFDASGVAVLPGCADPFGPKAIRASAGAILSVPIANVTAAQIADRSLFASDGNGPPVDPPVRDAVLVFGSEGAGVSADLLRRAKLIGISMSDRVESLNVAAAAAILLSRSFALRRK